MELSGSCSKILSHLSDDSKYDENQFKQYVDIAILSILQTSNKPLPEEIQEKLNNYSNQLIPQTFDQKAIQSSLIYLFLESAKHDYQTIELSHILEDHFTSNRNRLAYLCQIYESYKKDLRDSVLKQKSFSFPEIVSLDWRLDYVLKSNELNRIDEPIYTLRFKCKDGQEVSISCNPEQLQDLFQKVKDATKQVERTLEQL
ncbi:hypothetical protein ABK040_007982 [Willaertia magna]